MSINMADSIQTTWNKFERWQARYTKTCYKAIDKMTTGEDDYDSLEYHLFLQNWYEYDLDLIIDMGLSESDLQRRVANKINFLRGYLVDISYDGAEFMAQHSNFLSLQYPSKCNNAYSIWLEQYGDDDGNGIEAGASFHFQEFEIGFFCKSIEDIDLASMRNILPFDRLFIRRPKGENWDIDSIENITHLIKEDLESDYDVKVDFNKNDSGGLFSMNFTWDI